MTAQIDFTDHKCSWISRLMISRQFNQLLHQWLELVLLDIGDSFSFSWVHSEAVHSSKG